MVSFRNAQSLKKNYMVLLFKIHEKYFQNHQHNYLNRIIIVIQFRDSTMIMI